MTVPVQPGRIQPGAPVVVPGSPDSVYPLILRIDIDPTLFAVIGEAPPPGLPVVSAVQPGAVQPGGPSVVPGAAIAIVRAPLVSVLDPALFVVLA